MERGVECADHLRRTLREIDNPHVVLDGEPGAHRHVLGAVAVAVHPVFAVVGARPHLEDIGADAARGVVEQRGRIAPDRLRPVALDQGRKLLLAAPCAGHVRHQVAVAVSARAQIAEVEFQHVPAQLAALEQLDRRDFEPLAVEVLGVGVGGHVGRRAHIGQMTARHRPEHQLAFVEHRARQQRLAHMGVAEVSKIAHQHVAILDLTFEEVGGALHDPLHGHGLDRQRRIRHRDQIAGVIGDADGEVAAEIDDRCPGRALEGDHHLAPDVLVHAHDDAEGSGVDLAGSLPRLDLGKCGHRPLPLARRGRTAHSARLARAAQPGRDV